ncbi:MAG: ABC transporter permease [Planctomycetes bacterium]|nr:ABC transporter permease [Planctomycetota bacterium]
MIGHRLGRTFALGVRSLALHKLRSALTVLGIIFGVSSVISMLSIGEGASYEAQEEIKRLGSNNVILKSKKPSDEGGSGYERTEVTAYGLKWEDVRRIADTLPSLRMLVPLRMFPVEARFRRESLDVQVVGTTQDYLDVANVRVARGRFVTRGDEDALRPVCVLGSAAARALFPAEDPIGDHVKLGSQYFKVAGVLEETGSATGTGGSESGDRNRDVYVPLATAEQRYGSLTVRITSGSQLREKVELHQVICSLESDQQVPAAAQALRGLLARSHVKQDFEVLVPLELLEQKERTKRIFNIVLGSIAAISLLVGGIGIMNIMLASILERTREIGVRRALGAKRQDILTQFLVETVVLSTSGGLLGVLLGIAVPYAVEAASGMKTIITLHSILLSFGISAGVGVVFGLYPANRAASLDPIEALRRE